MLGFLKERRAQHHCAVGSGFMDPATDTLPLPVSAPSFTLSNANLD